MLRFSLNDSLLLTVFLPGAIFLAGVGWVTLPYIWVSMAPSIDNLFKGSGTNFSGTGLLGASFLAAAAFGVFFLAMFLGSVLGTIVGYAEVSIFDRRQRDKLDIEPDDYQKQWERYLDSLEKAHNSYVTKQVNAFQFQARSAIALLILILFGLASVLLGLTSLTKSSYVLVPAFCFAAFLSKAALDDHYELAEFRRRRFGVKPDPTAKPEESIRLLLDIWSKRSEFGPLKLVLSVLSPDGKTFERPNSESLAALQRVADLPITEVLPTEKCMVRLAIAALEERVASAAGKGGGTNP